MVGLGYDLVEVERLPGGLLRVTIDLPAPVAEGRSVTVEDCEKVTRQLQYVLEVEGLAYQRLEVSSPGLDRLLRGDADFRRFAGAQVELTLKTPFEGRKRFRGQLLERTEAEGGWRLVLAAAEPAVAGKAKRGTAKAPGPKTKAGVAAKGKAGAGGKTAAAFEGDQALDFTVAEVREARLVPVIDFKGRRFAPAAGATDAPDAENKTDGGRIQ